MRRLKVRFGGAKNATEEPEGLAGPADAAPAPTAAATATVAPAATATATAEREFPRPLSYGNPSLGSDPTGLPDPNVAVPDTVLDGARLGGLTVRGGSLRGDEHRYYGHTRQDSMGVWAFPGAEPKTTDAVLVCVADGVGSEPYSHVGSARACELVREEIRPYYRELLDPHVGDERVRSLCHLVAGGLARQLTNVAVRSKREPKSLSTTLVGALIAGDPADSAHRRCVVFAVGDSPAFLLRNGAFEPCFNDPHEGLISGTGTDALPTGFSKVETGVLSLGADDMLLLCTDGLSNPMRTKEIEQDLAAVRSRGEIPGLPEFGWQLSFRAKTYGDDRTAICVWGR